MKVIIRSTYFLIFSFIVLIFSCKKDNNNNGAPDPNANADLTTQVNSKLVSGFVTDENNLPVQDATVSIGLESIETDKYGYFEFRNVNVVKNAALVAVIKNGYFKAFKTYIAESGKDAFFRIKLIPKTIVGSLNANAGGSITLLNGMTVTIPANSIVLASGNIPYAGNVNIAAHWIDPSGNDLAAIMPGDLRGLNADGNLRLLKTFGMAAIELLGSGGEVLQIALGKKANLAFPLPTSFVSTAPPTIPLWYFDEILGLWKEEGVAIKTGDKYVGEVNHFSFWNCDLPNTYVQFNCTIVTSSGFPIQYAYVKISKVNDSLSTGYGFTDSSGFVGGAVPDNALLQLEVFANASSHEPCYSRTFSSGNTNISLGNIVIPIDVAHGTGTVTDCNNAPVTNGYMYLKNGSLFYRYLLNNTGTYNFTQLICGIGSNSFTFIGIDYSNLHQSIPIDYNLNAGIQTVPNVRVCDNPSLEYFRFTIDGVSYDFTMPPDDIQQISVGVPLRYDIECRGAGGGGANLFFEGANMAVGSHQPFVAFNHIRSMRPTLVNPVTVDITEYGAMGEFVSGNFSGTLIDFNTSAPYNVSCNFRIKRLRF